MRPVSRAWQRTVAGSYTPVYRVTLCETFQTGTHPAGTRLPIIDGTVRLDGAADIYTSAQLAFPGDLWPAQPYDDRVTSVAPYGQEVYVEAGIKYSDALVEMVGLGYLRLREPAQADAHIGGPVEVVAEDRNSTLARADLLAPRVYAATTTYGEMVEDLVLEVYPEAIIDWDDELEDAPIGRGIVVDLKRLDALKGVATATGKLMRWDHRGELTFRTPPTLLGSKPVARLASGHGGVLVQAARQLSDAGVVNAVVARGDGADGVAAAYAVAIDADPSSPTSYYSRFGPAPKHITSSLITTDAQAATVTQAELAKRAGLVHTVSFAMSPRPELEPDDLVYIEHSYGVGRHILAALEIPFMPGRQMTGVTRQQSVTLGGGA